MSSILIVVDDEGVCLAIADCMEEAGHVVKCARHGQAALTALRAEIPDIIILGLMAKKMDSAGFLEVMRSYLRWQKIPVVLLAEHTKELSTKQAKKFGVGEIFLKDNYQPKKLLAAIDALT